MACRNREVHENCDATGLWNRTKYAYDSDATCGTYNGDMVKRTDAKSTPNVTCYQYDGLHRMTASLPHAGSPDYSITPQKHYVYDQSASLGSMGRLGHAYTCPASTPDCTSSSTWITDLGFVYTPRGELSDVWEFTPHSGGAYYHVTATYWANGLINTLNTGLSGLPTWTYNPEGEGRVTSVIASSGTNPVPAGTTAVSYNTWGLPNGVTFGSGDSNTFVYDDSASGRLTGYTSTINVSPNQKLMTGALTWNANGSLRQLAIADNYNSNNAQTCTYQHDDLARIAAVNCGSGKWNQSFTYGSNNFGNVNWTGTGLGTNFTQAYDTTNNTNHFQGTGISYDANGNLLTDAVHTYTWDADGKLHQMDSTTMTYDALGRRVEESPSSALNYEILYGPEGSKLATINGSTQCANFFYLPLPGGTTAFYDCTGLKRYRHADWLGSSRLSSDTSRSVVYDGAYSPMGESYSETGTTDRNFTGQNQELANDLYAFQYREYQPIHGRWLSPDPAGLGGVNPTNPQSWNRYAYVNGSPLNSVDPLGLCDGSGGVWTFGGSCGFQQAMSWLVGAHGWDPVGGISIAPSDGVGGSGSVAYGDPADSSEARHVSIITTGWDPELQVFRTGTQYVPVGADLSSVLVQQKVLAAILIGKLACGGQAPSAIAGCMTQVYDQLALRDGDPATALHGGNYNFDYSQVAVNGVAFDPSEYGCLGNRCGVFDSLHFNPDTQSLHVDTANPWFVPIGSLAHLLVDVIGGWTWWSGSGIPRP